MRGFLPRRGRGRWLPLTSRPWRAVGYLVARGPLPAVGAAVVAIPAGARGWPGLLVGLPLLLGYVTVAVLASPKERRRVRLLGHRAVPDPHRQPGHPGPLAVVRLRLREATTWREAGYALASAALVVLDGMVVTGWVLGTPALLASPLLLPAGAGPIAVGPASIDSTAEAWAGSAAGAVLLVAGSYLVVGLAEAHAVLARALLGPRGGELRAQLVDLTRSRLRLVDAFDVERRRIERDLHDGAQQQLVALAMTLDLARIELEGTPHRTAATLVDQAHDQATRTITDLRDLIRAIHPPVLVELGLPAAVAELADRCPVPVAVDVDLPHRLPAGVETAAYFVVAEALANAVKHSGAPGVAVRAALDADLLVLEVRDDGVGGADADRGSGLTGLGDRVAAVGGRLTLSSPPGGPTVVCARIPTGAEAP